MSADTESIKCVLGMLIACDYFIRLFFNQLISLLVGDGGVGKTCLLKAYATNKFSNEYDPTVLDNCAVTILVGGNPFTLLIFDSAGQEEYAGLRALSYPQTDIFLICFSVINPQSFENIKTIVRNVY